MHIKICLILAGLLAISTPAAADTLSRFAMSSEKMAEFTQKCVSLPSDQEIEKDLQTWIEHNRKNDKPLPSIRLDGFAFQNVSETDFLAIRTLTISRNAHGSESALFRFSLNVHNGQAVVERACTSKSCGADGLTEKKVSLSRFQTNQPACTDSLCAAKRIFGEQTGPWILWAFMKYGTNLSPMSDHTADPAGLDVDTLRSILAAAQLLPEHLRSVALKNTGFYRFLKGQSLPAYKGQRVVANSFGGVFDPIEKMNFAEKVYFFTHELAHRTRLLAKPVLDESAEWLRAAGWKDLKTPPESVQWSSRYAAVNPFEDFAESYSLYRLEPARLKKLSPERYSYMKARVFQGLEYEQEACSGTRPLQSAAR